MTARGVVQTLVRRLLLLDRGDFRRIIWFGSHPSGQASETSDVDLMALVEPSTAAWGPKENIGERQRIESAIAGSSMRIDLWVRTTDQFEEARAVVGGLEYAADAHGEVVFSRPLKRTPRIRRSPHDIRVRNIGDWLELARRMLGRAVMLRWPRPGYEQPNQVRGSEHYAHRAALAAIGAVFVARGIEPPSKKDDLSCWLTRLREIDERAARALERELTNSPVTPTVAHGVMRTVVTHLALDRQLDPIVRYMTLYLAHPTHELGAVPPLKQPAPSVAQRAARPSTSR
jgi:predicted nucleotidyltransferase